MGSSMMTNISLYLTTLFFFSSRRRHTRFDCDWSSDVCSSDLGTRRPGCETCAGDPLVVRWRDLHPGRLVPADGPVLRIERLVGERWDTVAWDDDRELEIRAVRSLGGRGYVWEARWHHPARAGPFRAVLVARAGLAEVTGDRVRC